MCICQEWSTRGQRFILWPATSQEGEKKFGDGEVEQFPERGYQAGQDVESSPDQAEGSGGEL